MKKQNRKDFTTICIRKEEYKKLNGYKNYGSEPMWLIIKRFIDEKKEVGKEDGK